MTVLVFGDQLTWRRGPVAADPDESVLLIESTSFAERHPYHPHKLTLVFSAMRHFRDALRERGRTVWYRQCETFEDGIAANLSAHPGDDLVAMRPASHGAGDRLRDLVTAHGGSLELVDNDLFLCAPATFDDWAADRSEFTHEAFYRFMRRRTGYLMDGDDPIGGQWNYDEENRETPPAGYDPPSPPRFEPDALTRETESWVAETFDGGYEEPPYGGAWANPEPFRWPVTRAEALTALDAFVTDRLPEFGPYQDAMVEGEWALDHALLSPALNLGLLHPAEVVEAAIERVDDPEVPRNSLEGFVRQVLGWREFVRHAYRVGMPDLVEANRLDATAALPECYWTGDTDMACLADAVEGVRKRGYSHHIQRLMVLSNFALLYGVEPRELNRWFHAAYVDASHWVTTPNVIEMGLFAGDLFATKPYAASANYVDRMSDYCDGCAYDPDETVGEGACPFNALYWDFLDRNEGDLRENHRMGLVYHHLDDKDREPIRERAAAVRERARDGEL